MEAWPKVATEGEVKAIVKPKETLAFGDSETKALRSVAGHRHVPVMDWLAL
jgi:hypothetical protein